MPKKSAPSAASGPWVVRGTLELAGEAGFGYYLLGGTRLHLGKPLVVFIGKHAVSGTLEAMTVGADHPENTFYLSHMRICIGAQLPQHTLYYVDAGTTKILLQEGLPAALPR